MNSSQDKSDLGEVEADLIIDSASEFSAHHYGHGRKGMKRGSPDELSLEHGTSPKKRSRLSTITIKPPTMAYPRSLFTSGTSGEASQSFTKERDALQELMRYHRSTKSAVESTDPGHYLTVLLDDFSIYRGNNGMHPNVMRPLCDLLTRNGDSSYLFDGTLKLDNHTYKVKGVPFSILSLDGYGTDVVSIRDKIWIQSPLAERLNVWYILGNPSVEYTRYHEPFLWLADFAKHFVSYLDFRDDVRGITLHDFKSKFNEWLHQRYANDPIYAEWAAKFGNTDFRTVIAANYDFLWKESVNVQYENRRCYLWKEVDAKSLSAVPLQPLKVTDTIVTPYVYRCFSNMYFKSVLECRVPVEEVRWASTRRATAFEARASVAQVIDTTAAPQAISRQGSRLIVPGDVVVLEKDKTTPWKSVADYWYAYVQGVEKRKQGDFLRVIWMYLPEDTTCAKMNYPYRRELFFSDHCNCGSVNISVDEVLGKVNVKFSRDQRGEYDFFVRQTYITDKESSAFASFTTFKKDHMKCDCHSQQASSYTAYKRGHTVLVSGLTKGLLEPVVLTESPVSQQTKVRRLLRRQQFGDNESRANELVYTDEFVHVNVKHIRRHCHVRVYSPRQIRQREVPPPYSYDGTGDCWIMSSRVVHGQEFPQPLDDNNKVGELELVEGFDPTFTNSRIPLNGLSLFCGGGSFDRGSEESGAVKFTHSVDWAQAAIHTCRANSEDPEKLKLFYGNVNDFLARVMKADASTVIPQVGTIGMITAGSPCVAFSLLQPDRMSEGSLRNASLVAALATAVDLYRPDYGLFENVFAMGHGRGVNKEENVLSQLVCTFVGMGYQVQIFNQDAHSSGSGEQRSRLILSIAAPGLVPLTKPANTHSHPEHAMDRKVGNASNGVPFGQRSFELTPFFNVTAEQIIGDLPNIGDGLVNLCVPFPDHRISAGRRYENFLKIKHIPRFPYGCSWRSAVAMGYMPQGVIDSVNRKSELWKSENNRAFGRVYPDRQLPTIITRVTPDCAMNGRALHYDQPRVLTVMEARRAQSYPDHEVLIGNATDQWKVVGNSVDRKMSAATGVALREAWLANDNDYQDYIASYTLDRSELATAAESVTMLFLDNSQSQSALLTHDVGTDEDELAGTNGNTGHDLVTHDNPLSGKQRADADGGLIVVARLKPDQKRASLLKSLEAHKAGKVRHSLPSTLSHDATRFSTDELGTQVLFPEPKQAASSPPKSAVVFERAGAIQPEVAKRSALQGVSTIATYNLPEAASLLSSPAIASASQPPTIKPASVFARYAARPPKPKEHTRPKTSQFGQALIGSTRVATSTSRQSAPVSAMSRVPSTITQAYRAQRQVRPTSGFLSPPSSGNPSPSPNLSTQPLHEQQRGPFETINQQQPLTGQDDDEDELNMNVASAVGMMSTGMNVTLGDVLEEHREHAHGGSSEVLQGFVEKDWMDYELTG